VEQACKAETGATLSKPRTGVDFINSFSEKNGHFCSNYNCLFFSLDRNIICFEEKAKILRQKAKIAENAVVSIGTRGKINKGAKHKVCAQT
jgi:hypothetical protein